MTNPVLVLQDTKKSIIIKAVYSLSLCRPRLCLSFIVVLYILYFGVNASNHPSSNT